MQEMISERDWDKLYCCASLLVNSIEDHDKSQDKLDIKIQMVSKVLDSLESKYGPHPAILALRGDYYSHAGMGHALDADSIH